VELGSHPTDETVRDTELSEEGREGLGVGFTIAAFLS
jgi:hypothetical protein